MFEFKILSQNKKSRARVGELQTVHGKLISPELAFVATEGEVKSIPKDILPKLPVNLLITNTFHLWVKNIIDKFEKGTDVHEYANFQKPMMSDSGGFQVFSLGFGKAHGVGKIEAKNDQHKFNSSKQNPSFDNNNPLKITDKGVEFIFNEKKLLLTPEKSMQIQKKIGADIIFAFDECTSPLNSYEYTKKAMERTHDWLLRCLKQKKKDEKIKFFDEFVSDDSDILSGKEITWNKNSHRQTSNSLSQALFGIVQGGQFANLRTESAKFASRQDVTGFGIGGAFGWKKENMEQVFQAVIPYLPDGKPRHLLGIGQIRDIFLGVENGIDTFDCVIPTREARHKVLYTRKGKINLRKVKNVKEIIEKGCKCLSCSNKLTFQQMYQLFLNKDSRSYFFATVHNMQFFLDLFKDIRSAIELNSFSNLKNNILTYY